MVLINEWLPNPLGSDAEGEWVELFNDGTMPVNLSGWVLVSKGGRGFPLGARTIGAGDYLLLPRTETKLTLHNMDGALALYDASGKLVDEVRFLGTAPEGKSLARRLVPRSDGGNFGEGRFAFTDPTPGAKNIFPELALVAENLPIDQPLNPPLGLLELFAIALSGAAILAMLILIAVKRNENFSKLFFGKN